MDQSCLKTSCIIWDPKGSCFVDGNIVIISSAGIDHEMGVTYGTISSLRPERKSTGTSVIVGMMVSDGQI